jgi:serine/threonine protein kinase/WD40 repeat protein
MTADDSPTISESSGGWDRVLTLIDELEALPRPDAEARLRTLEADGESAEVLARVRIHLRIPTSRQELPPETIIGGEYRIVGRLGSGGMGIVYEAVLEKTGQTVALKMIHPGLVLGDSRPRFIREMKALGRLDHPGIVGIRHAGSHTFEASGETSEFFTMERIAGFRLHEYLKTTNATLTEKLRLMRDVAIAVQYAHDRGVIHRDLKPGNMIVRSDGRAMIFDFGLAAAVSGAETPDHHGICEGTPPYMAPEQADALIPSPAVDIYSLGAILYEILAGRPLFQANHLASYTVQMQTVRSPPRREPLQIPDAPKALEEILEKSLALMPEDRFPSAAAFARALNRLLPAHLVKDPPHEWRPAPGAAIPATDWVLDRMLGDGAQGQVWVVRNQPESGETTTGAADEMPLIPPPRVYKFCASEESARALRREVRVFQALKTAAASANSAALSRQADDGRNPDISGGSTRAADEIPGIVPIESWSLDEPPYYICLRYLENARDLADWAVERTVTEEQALSIVTSVADALQFAHNVGVLHRDVKPGNILVADDPKAPAGVRAWLVDFGLAAFDENLWHSILARSVSSRSDYDRLAGTPDYLAPEIKRRRAPTTQSDLYSLGVVFYRLLRGDMVGSLNHWKDSVADPFLRSDLERLLADDPDARFPSASALAESLRKLPERRAAAETAAKAAAEAEVRRNAELQAAARAAYRRGALRTAGIAAAVVAAVGGLAAFSYQKYREASRNEFQLRMAETRALRQSAHPVSRRQILDRIAETGGKIAPEDIPALRKEALDALCVPAPGGQSPPSLLVSLPADAGPLAAQDDWLAWPVGSELHAAKIASSTLENPVHLALPAPVARAAVSSGGKWLAALTNDGNLFVASGPGEAPQQIATGCGLEGLAVHDSGWIAAPGAGGQVQLFKRETSGWVPGLRLGSVPPSLTNPHAPAADASAPMIPSAEILAFSADGQFLAVGGSATLHVSVWEPATGRLVYRFPHQHFPTAAVWDRRIHGKLWTAAADGAIFRWDLPQSLAGTDAPLAPSVSALPEPSAAPAVSLAVSSDGVFLDCLDAQGQRTVRWADRLEIEESSRTDGIVRSGFDSSGGCWTLATNGALTIRRNPVPAVRVWKIGDFPVLRLARSPDDRMLAASCGTFAVVTDAVEFAQPTVLPGKSRIVGVAFSSLSPRAYGAAVKGLESWEWQESSNQAVFHRRPSNHDFSYAGEIVSAGVGDARRLVLSEGDSLHVLQFGNSQPLMRIRGTGLVNALAAGKNSPWLASARAGKSPTTLWFPADNTSLTLSPPSEDVLGLACSSDGKWIVERTTSGIRVHESASRKLQSEFALTLPPPDARTTPTICAPVAVSDDGSLVAAAAPGARIVLFQPGSAAPLAEWSLPALSTPSSLTFVAGDTLVAGTADGCLWVWKLPALRTELRRLGLDWEPRAAAPAPSAPPLQTEFQNG